MLDRPPVRFIETFIPVVCEMLADALRVACDNAAEHHDPAVGSNNQTFGISAYNFANFELRKRTEWESPMIEFVSDYPVVRFRAGEYEFGAYKVGRSEADNINECFPNSETAAADMIPYPYLPGLEPELENAREVVLAYMANPDDGLCAAFLCLPSAKENNRITEWGFVKEIYRVDRSVTPIGEGAAKHPPEFIGEVEVVRKRAATDDQR